MAIAELIGIIIVGALSAIDVLLNLFTACMTGSCHSTCCDCFEFDHNDEQNKTPRFKVTESLMRIINDKNDKSEDIK